MCFGPRACVIVHTHKGDVCAPTRRGQGTPVGRPRDVSRTAVNSIAISAIVFTPRPRAFLRKAVPAAHDDAFPTSSCPGARHGVQNPSAQRHQHTSTQRSPAIQPRSTTGTLSISATCVKLWIYNDPTVSRLSCALIPIPNVLHDGSILYGQTYHVQRCRMHIHNT